MRILIPLAMLLGLGLLVGCGGGGGDAGPAFDLSGWWELGTRSSGSPAPYELGLIMPTRQTGALVEFNDTDFAFEGTTLRGAKPDAADPNRTEYTLNVVSNDHVEGVAVRYAGGVPDSSEDVRMLRYPPPFGTLSGYGSIGTAPVGFTSSTAYAISEEDPAAPSYTLWLIDLQPDGSNLLALNFSRVAPILNGLYFFGGTLDRAIVSADGEGGSATGGTVEITASSLNSIRGSYDLTFPSGRVTGSFDVEILIQN